MIMDVFDVLLHLGLVTSALAVYMILRKQAQIYRMSSQPGWKFPWKYLFALYAVRRWKWQRRDDVLPFLELPRPDLMEGTDEIRFRATSADGTTVLLGVRKQNSKETIAEVTVFVRLADGTCYQLPRHPDTAVGVWESYEDGWSAGGLKIQILEPQLRLRINYNGLLTRINDGVIQHVTMNFIWASGSSSARHPEDWSIQLASRALALEPWRDGDWKTLLDKLPEGSWMQWGAIQGRFQAFNSEGMLKTNEYLRVRGVKERSWSTKTQGPIRSVNIVATARDGTAVYLKASTYKDVLSKCIYGNIRFPNSEVVSLKSTDFTISDFADNPKEIPKTYTINVAAKDRTLKLVLTSNEIGGKFYEGVPYRQEMLHRAMHISINDYHGTGILELGYGLTGAMQPKTQLSPRPKLRWLSKKEAGAVGYCLPLDDKAASCTELVGGKGASLALLSSIQLQEGYKVPPGYCLTTKALDKQLESNQNLKKAIQEIEAENENYDEKNFKKKCERASELIAKTDITKEIREEIIRHLNKLREDALKQNLGPNLQFAVRSSAVGEDSEALSAAGQNETILGCSSDEDVFLGIQKCWASMYAFTSAYYRRQNGQPCLCGGAVVIQVLIAPLSAGVMFTRHPQAGDPSRLLITANYGLGESVVSGSVEPDTIEVFRCEDSLKVSKVELGSKTSRVKASKDGVITEDVPEDERNNACLSEDIILKLVKIGVRQEELWGAGRDIEWAVAEGGEIYLLQARPITSLERWTEEELLHENDDPIMSDDELISFANTGEVFPDPVTSLSYDLVTLPLKRGTNKKIRTRNDFDDGMTTTHNRVTLNLYNSIYRRFPKEIDIGVKMVEMAIHGHTVADSHIADMAKHRHHPGVWQQIEAVTILLESIVNSWFVTKKTVKEANNMTIDQLTSDNPNDFLKEMTLSNEPLYNCSLYHSTTSTASTGTQIIAMSIMMEGAKDITLEFCNEISILLSAGGVLSAEVPVILAKICRDIETSGRTKEFRAQKPNEALQWLETNLPQIHGTVMKFLEEYGHRTYMEFDLIAKPWVLVPEELMEVLQSMNAKEEKEITKTSQEIVDSLKTPKKSGTRTALRWMIPLLRTAIRQRECTKAYLILSVHKVRLAAIKLGKLLVKQWYLPQEDLVFHFRIHELKRYVLTRDPALLKKAMQRRQYYPAWCKLRFNELNTGWVDAVQPQIHATVGDARIDAASVCGGEVVARACVIKDFSEINQLKDGDVLITHCTDIGWSPYFPLLTGIVTELGGIISHGAVIAREYGLPCIVGAGFATDVFKTGDIVRLSGTKGFIERVGISTGEELKDSKEENSKFD